MGADIKKLRNRIKSVDSTLHLTRAMGLVASSKIRRVTEAMHQSRSYADAVAKTIELLIRCPECARSRYMEQRNGTKTRLIVIAGDRGLAGGYNANVFRLLREYPDAEVIPIGKKACERFAGKPYGAESFSYADAIALANELCSDFASSAYTKLGILHTRYISMMTQQPAVDWILPLARSDKKQTDILFEPDALTMLNTVIPIYVAGVLYADVRESFASESAARRCAMDAAGKNAKQMIDDLQLSYNRARQGAITQEITEIVAGSGT